MAWMRIPRAAKLYGLRSSAIHEGRKNGLPEWMELRGNTYFVDTSAKGFQLYLRKRKKKSDAAKRGIEKKNAREGSSKAKTSSDIRNEILNKPKLLKIQEESIVAEMSAPIYKRTKERQAIEQGKIKLEKESGNLISRELADFLFMGYLERFNRELLQFKNKLKPEFDKIILNIMVDTKEKKEVDIKKFTLKICKKIDTEIEEIIRNVKRDQLKALQDWALENKIEL